MFSGLIPWTRMFPSWNQLFGKGGRNNIESVSDIFPSVTFTKPTAQGDAGEELAVSKSMLMNSMATHQV